MKRSDTGLTEEPGTLALGGSDPTERLPSGPGPRTVLGRYRLEQRLGAGGFGVVWHAWDERLEREVAVKVIPRERGGGERVEREALASARLNHPAIVGIYELASDDDDVYLVSELVRGRTLAELLRAGAISDRDVSRIGADLCDALAHAHARGVIHRDLKPQNVMVVAEPAAGVGFAKLTDFGVAHLVSGDMITRTGDVVGTLAYMAPEQAEGARVTPACDVYSLALTLYEAWTGRNPVRAGGPAATARPPRPAAAVARLPAPRPAARALRRHRRCARRRPRPAAHAGRLRAELRAVQTDLTDEGGLVEPETLRRVGLPTTRRTRRLFSRRDDGAAAGGFFREDASAPTGVLGRAEPGAQPARWVRLAERAGAGLLAGGIVLGVS